MFLKLELVAMVGLALSLLLHQTRVFWLPGVATMLAGIGLIAELGQSSAWLLVGGAALIVLGFVYMLIASELNYRVDASRDRRLMRGGKLMGFLTGNLTTGEMPTLLLDSSRAVRLNR